MDLTLIEDSGGNLVVNETATSVTVNAVAGTSIEVPAQVVSSVIEISTAPLARGIADFQRTSGDGSVGTIDTYTITFTDGTTSTFTVRNGSAGSSSYTEFISASGDTSGATDTNAIQTALNAGKSVRLVNNATYNVTGLVLKTGSKLYINGATLRLANGSNADVITTENFSSLAGGNTTGGVHSWSVYGPGMIDGNKANQTFTSLPTVVSANFNLSSNFTVQLSSTANLPSSGRATVNTQSGPQYFDWSANNTGTNTLTASAPGTGRVSTGNRVATSGYGIRAYGYNFYIGGSLTIKNCAADGLWTEWGSGNIGPGTPEMESIVYSVKCYENGRNGYSALGPHDSFIRDVVCFRNTEYGLNEGGGSVHQISGFHGWGSPQRVSAAIRNQSTLVDCVFEVTSASGSRGLEVYGNKIKARGVRILQSAGSNGGQVGVEMLNNAAGCDLDFQFDGGFANGAVRLHSTGGGNKVRAVVNDNGANALVQGVSLSATDDYEVLAGTATTAASVTTALDKKSNTGHTHAASEIVSGVISTAQLGTGTASSSEILAGNSVWTNKQEITRRYEFSPGSPGAGGRQWMRLFTINGLGPSSGASITGILAGTGDYGNANRGQMFIRFGQRGSNVTSFKAWAFGVADTQFPVEFYTKQISEFVFELWARLTPYNHPHVFQLLSSTNATINLDSATTTAPTGIVQWPVNDMGTDSASAIAATTSAANMIPYFTGVGTAATTSFTSYARSFVGSGSASVARGVLEMPDVTQAEAAAGTITLPRTWTPERVKQAIAALPPASHTHAAADIASGVIAPARLGSGTADATTYLRGDGTWQVVTSGGGSSTLAGLTDVSITSPASAQVLRHDGTNWKNTALIISDVTNLQSTLNTKVSLTGAETLTNKTLTAPRITGTIADSTGASIISLSESASAVNFVSISNSAAGSGPSVSATGTDTNVNLNLVPKGTGVVNVFSGLNFPDAVNISFNTTTGTKIGTSNSQKIGFLNATPVTQQAVGVDLGSVLSNFGFRQGGQSYVLTTSGTTTLSGINNLTGPLRLGTTTVTTNQTPGLASGVGSIWFEDASAGNLTITLPSTTTSGYQYTIKKVDSSANTVTVVMSSVDGATNYVLSSQWDWVTVVSTATSGTYRVIGASRVGTHNHDGVYEPFQAAGTTAQYRRGDKTWQTLDKNAVGLANVDNTSDANKPVSTATQSALNLKADDNAVVKLTGAQTVAGVKTFSDAPVVPDAAFAIAKTSGLQAALDARALDNVVVKLTGAQTLAGIKTFSDTPVVPDGSFSIAKTVNLQSTLDSLDANKSATPVTGTKVMWIFKFTDASVARPTVPSYVALNWIGPAGAGNTAPTNMATDDVWDMTS